MVRRFIIENAVHWMHEYRFDGLRLDATHALVDDSPEHLVADLARDRARGRRTCPVVDPRRGPPQPHGHGRGPPERGGWGADAVWADDFTTSSAGCWPAIAHGYYADFEGTTDEAGPDRDARDGCSPDSSRRNAGEPRGTDPVGTCRCGARWSASRITIRWATARRAIVCITSIDHAAWRAASTLLLTVPMTPLLFMGQEWAATRPFQYFTEMEPELLAGSSPRADAVSSQAFPEFSDAAARERIPDPQADSTFERSRLNWEERGTGIHALTLALYRDLLHLRRAHPALAGSDAPAGEAVAIDEGAVVVRRQHGDERFAIVVQLAGSSRVAVDDTGARAADPSIVLSTEDERFAPDPEPPGVERHGGRLVVSFRRPGAMIVRFA
jgi:maltooligosyltrehalose trehalohydrolase